MKKLLLALILLTSAANAKDGVGNADSDEIKRKALEHLLESNAYYLKTSMINYVDTLQIDQIPALTETDRVAKNFFEKIGKERVKADILASPYLTGNNCHDEYKPELSARALIGDLKGQICFDMDRFHRENKDETLEQRMILLASLAFHEEVHHFQKKGISDTIGLENQAHRVSAYVLNTATFGNIPSLIWSDQRNVSKEYFQIVMCQTLVGPKVGTYVPNKAVEILRRRKETRPWIGAPERLSFSVNFWDDAGTHPGVEADNRPMWPDSKVPIILDDSKNGSFPTRTELINPSHEFIGPVTRMKFNGQFEVKRAKFIVKSKVVTVKVDFDNAASSALGNGMSINEALQKAAAQYEAGLINSEIVCDVEGLVQ
jgi:hypothetical protein